jgi:hypothetical protein
MTRLILGLCAVKIWLLAGTLFAEQIVVTKSGTTLIGTVSFEDDAVIVEFANGNLRVPLTDVVAVATIAADGGGNAQGHTQAQALLLKALEARLLKNGGEEAAGILAEAARIAPEDAQIAFWYASALVDAGEGKEANDVVNRHREAISAAYPNMFTTLVARIEQRLKLESLPRELMNRIDRLNAFAAAQPVTGDDQQMFAAFRVVDQDQSALPANSFRIECNGHDDKLETFDSGHFLLIFKQNRSSEGGICKLMITQPGYESRTFEFSASPSEVKNVGEFVVKKYEEAARRSVHVHVVDGAGKPLSGAQVRLYSQSSRNSSAYDSLSANTDAQGNAEILAYPLEYTYRVAANGMNPAQGSLAVKETSAVPETKVTLYAALQGSLHVHWLRKTDGDGGESTTGNAIIEIPAVQRGYNPMEFGPEVWLRPAQVKGQLVLHLTTGMFGYAYPGRGRSTAWVGKVKVDAPDEADRARITAEQFEELDLNNFDELKKEYPRADEANLGPIPGPTATAIAAKEGDIFIGTFEIRDPRTNRPMEIVFKAFVEKLQPIVEPTEES